MKKDFYDINKIKNVCFDEFIISPRYTGFIIGTMLNYRRKLLKDTDIKIYLNAIYGKKEENEKMKLKDFLKNKGYLEHDVNVLYEDTDAITISIKRELTKLEKLDKYVKLLLEVKCPDTSCNNCNCYLNDEMKCCVCRVSDAFRELKEELKEKGIE